MIPHPVILFDGYCHLCNGSVDFLLRQDVQRKFRYVPLQSTAGEALMKKFRIARETDSVILIYRHRVYLESEAVLQTAGLLPMPWKLALSFRIIPRKWRDALYRWVAGNRYRWFGKRDRCRTATKEERPLFPGPESLEI